MKIVPIFEGELMAENCKLWAVCYTDEDNDCENIFDLLFDQWNNSEYLLKFFANNISHLSRPIWNGMTINDAMDQVFDEAADFEDELKGIEKGDPEFFGQTLDDVFRQLSKNEFAKKQNINQKKARPNLRNSMLRLYAIRLDDGCYIVTGGGIKLADTMLESNLNLEIARLNRLQDYLKREGISDKHGLLT